MIREQLRVALNRLSSIDHFQLSSIMVWISIVFFTLLKVYFITPADISNDNFITSYQYLTPDSYDWIVNGKYLFENNDISFRQPALPLLIKILLSFNILGLLPLINHATLIVLLFIIYKLNFKLKEKEKYQYLILFVILILFNNYYLQYFANYILADLYAITFIAAGFYFLFQKKPLMAYLMLGISWCFQNFSPFLIPAFLSYQLTTSGNKFFSIDNFIYYAKCFIVFSTPTLWWLIYKYILFGDIFYSKVTQFGLIDPNLNSLSYYGFNSLAIFGFITIPIILVLIVKFKSFWLEKHLLSIFIGIIITFTLWIVFYEWNDRRFLLYFIPFYVPLKYFALANIRWNRLLITILLFILSFNTFVAVDYAKFETTLPITYWHKVELIDNNYVLSESTPRLRSLPSPFIYNAYVTQNSNRYQKNHIGGVYYKIIEKNYDEKTDILCLNREQIFIYNYEFNNIFKYMYSGRSYLDTTIKDDCIMNLS
jgi:hypothetical protein